MRSVVWTRRLAGFALVCFASAGLASNTSCILLDGPADLPVPPIRRPTILRSEVLPPATAPIGALLPEGKFTVPIQLGDPTQSVNWFAWVDYAPDNEQPIDNNSILGSSSAPDIVTVTFNVSQQRVQGTECHTIHFLVALSSAFNGTPHDTDPSLSDTVDWYFAPGGNAGGCTTYDGGGNDGAFPAVDGDIEDAGDGSSD